MFQNNLRAPKRLETIFFFISTLFYLWQAISLFIMYSGKADIIFKVNQFLSDPLRTKSNP